MVLLHGLLSGGSRGTRAAEGFPGPVVVLDEGVGISKEGNLGELVAAEGSGHGTVDDSSLTADVEARGAARIGEGHCRRKVATEHRVEADGAADGAAEATLVSALTLTLVEVVHLNVVVHTAPVAEADAALEHAGVVDLNTVLLDLNIGDLEGLVGGAEKTRAGVHATLEHEAELHLAADLSTIDDLEGVGILSVQGTTRSRVAVGHLFM